ncbi:hypothetical protein [Halapricum desulfuricans]|uniref:DUF8144 domain-containing protein n=1 Tax=Halapricum desulfuricans TaxID=2841257 RepID=A0A897NH48_9EURY|nr:hypothetical protein [Halapricum desulfuricans]QSG04517.1 hypothetical protein HSR121_0158 [Halapricum desulfuricans]QSG10293.1 hypothetical protein HSR122_2923 [Halapricum desulfuricans]
MAESAIVDFIEEYQAGVLIAVGTLTGGLLVLVAAGQIVDTLESMAALGVFVAGAVVTFLSLSYLLYGR